jgi:diguanylate cyclase (GGDEF)-like protein/PAS domain S-box-containing protein
MINDPGQQGNRLASDDIFADVPKYVSAVQVADAAGICLSCFDHNARLLDASAAFCALHNTTRASLVGVAIDQLYAGSLWTEVRAQLFQVLSTGESVAVEYALARDGQAPHWRRSRAWPLRNAQGEIIGVIDSSLDVDDEVRSRAKLEESERRLAVVANNTPHPLSYLDLDRRYVFANDAFLRNEQLKRESVIGAVFSAVHPTETVRLVVPMLERAFRGERCLLESQRPEADGSRRWVRSEFAPDFDDQGEVRGVYVVGTDIHDLKIAQERLHTMAHTDALTGLPNRPALRDYVDRRLASAARAHSKLAVLFIDLDGFKTINDGHGHRMGDDVLRLVSRALLGAFREGDFLGRLAGDEFMAVLDDVVDREEAVRVAQRGVDAVNRPWVLDGRELRVTASIGVAVFPEDGATYDSLFRASDQAMYRAKGRGRNRVQTVAE